MLSSAPVLPATPTWVSQLQEQQSRLASVPLQGWPQAPPGSTHLVLQSCLQRPCTLIFHGLPTPSSQGPRTIKAITQLPRAKDHQGHPFKHNMPVTGHVHMPEASCLFTVDIASENTALTPLLQMIQMGLNQNPRVAVAVGCAGGRGAALRGLSRRLVHHL